MIYEVEFSFWTGCCRILPCGAYVIETTSSQEVAEKCPKSIDDEALLKMLAFQKSAVCRLH
jgi:hypothetical protein